MDNRDLDKWLAENVMQWHLDYTIGRWWTNKGKHQIHIDDWSPTKSISHAFEIVEKMRNNHFKWFEMASRPNGYICNFVGDPKFTEFAETASLAVCLAAKKAIEGPQ